MNDEYPRTIGSGRPHGLSLLGQTASSGGKGNQPPRQRRHYTRTLSALLLALLSFCGCSAIIGTGGCAWIEAHRDGVNATLSVVAKQTVGIIMTVVVPAATDYIDSGRKADLVDGLAVGFRSHDWSASISSDEVFKLVDAWTPDKSHWEEAAKRFEELWAAHPPRTQREAAILAEAVAEGLNAAAYRSRIEAQAVLAKAGVE